MLTIKKLEVKLNIEKFIRINPFLYHLTDRRNLPHIIESRRLMSTSELVNSSDLENKEDFIRVRRPSHAELSYNGRTLYIRDQKPISLVVLERSLTDNWTSSDFIEHLNKRVFFWPNLNRLQKHFNRYEGENPVILRFSTDEILALNSDAEFSRLNSGATRCSSHWNGNAPERGPRTFLNAQNYMLSERLVAEVTIPNFSFLPDSFEKTNNPNNNWEVVRI